MPSKVKIVTDSSAHFSDPELVERYDITVVPLSIRWRGRTYQEGIDLDPADFLAQLGNYPDLPELLPPSLETFQAVYTRLARHTDRILSIHLSHAMHATGKVAQAATQSLLGRCTISVFDSKNIGLGLALVVEEAARLAETCDSLDEIVRALRKQLTRLYAIFSLERLIYAERYGLLSHAQRLLGELLGIRPILTIEEGELLAMEKVRNSAQTVDKFVEFMLEFTNVERLLLLQGTTQPTEQTTMLIERLSLEFAQRDYPTALYQPSLACYLGPHASGIMVCEAPLSLERRRQPYKVEEQE
ncbi:MAG: DegV family protein [Anaerolineae bacterium]|nr:DegV family protein [Anaerolineae bacterium]